MKSLLHLFTISLALLLPAVYGYQPSCGLCIRERCPPRPNCPHGVVKDLCNCCDACLRDEEEVCGNVNNFRGQCKIGLFCYNPDPVFTVDQEGVCKPISYILYLRKSTTTTAATTTDPCASSQFYCKADKHCILKRFVCDKNNDCSDGQDEVYPTCQTTTTTTTTTTEKPCPSSQFYCEAEKHCILKRFVCDGERDCSDGQDEADCITPSTTTITTTTKESTTANPCPPSRYYCKADDYCLDKKNLCDGINDCTNAEDEVYPACPTTTTTTTTTTTPESTTTAKSCPADRYYCKTDDFCLLNERLCDGINDCTNDEDEDYLACPTTTTTETTSAGP